MVRLKVQMVITFLENVYTSSFYLENGTSNCNCVPKQKGYTNGKKIWYCQPVIV